MSRWESDDALDAYITQMSDVLELKINPAYRPEIKQFLTLAAEMADTLEMAPLDPHEMALAPVFRLPQLD